MKAPTATHYGLGDSSLLERIDQLFSCGAGNLIDIPQIVVVGDQSSGKSSVLSGLIRKNLPRSSGLCTRFATKIVFRRAEIKEIRAFIIPDENSSQEHREKVKACGEFDIGDFDGFRFDEIMAKVHEIIGVAGPDEHSQSKPTFSGDVLQLEISGPNEEHLSVIDVPGIFRDVTPGITTKNDIDLVRSMVLHYMKNPRSVMLTVIPANVDVATQEILRMANDLDLEGHRTLGVLTKPDLVDSGAEHHIVDLIEGKARKITLGWHLLRNPGQKDLAASSFDRQRQEEDFFCTKSPWNTISKENVGIEALRIRLKDVLSRLIRREFVNVKTEVQKKLTNAEGKLKELGLERNSRAAQATYLTDLSVKFQSLVDLALGAKFGSSNLFDEHDDLKIAPLIVRRMDEFKQDMINFGHTHAFHDLKRPADWLAESTKERTFVLSPTPSEIVPKLLEVTKCLASLDLEDMLAEPTQWQRPTMDSTDKWLHKLHSQNRGFELGTFDPDILASAMKQQTKRWNSISHGFVSDIVIMVHTFIKRALECLCIDERTQNALHAAIEDELRARYTSALDQLKFIIMVELDGVPMTLSNHFIDRLEDSRQTRFLGLLDKHAILDNNYGSIVKIQDLSIVHPLSNKQYTVRDIHDILQSYYEVARNRFVDNVSKQAVDFFLVNGPGTPLRVFSPNFVSQMSDEQLEAIAKEEPQAQRYRAKLTKDIESLRQAKRALS